MNKNSKVSLAIVALSILIAIFTLVLPSLYIEANKTVIMGWTSTFGGVIKNFDGPTPHIYPSVGGIINFVLPLLTACLVYFVGKSQKSTYFVSFLLFIAIIITNLCSQIFFTNINVAGGISGIKSLIPSVGVYVNVVLASIGALASLVALIYKPNARFNKKY